MGVGADIKIPLAVSRKENLFGSVRWNLAVCWTGGFPRETYSVTQPQRSVRGGIYSVKERNNYKRRRLCGACKYPIYPIDLAGLSPSQSWWYLFFLGLCLFLFIHGFTLYARRIRYLPAEMRKCLIRLGHPVRVFTFLNRRAFTF